MTSFASFAFCMLSLGVLLPLLVGGAKRWIVPGVLIGMPGCPTKGGVHSSAQADIAGTAAGMGLVMLLGFILTVCPITGIVMCADMLFGPAEAYPDMFARDVFVSLFLTVLVLLASVVWIAREAARVHHARNPQAVEVVHRHTVEDYGGEVADARFHLSVAMSKLQAVEAGSVTQPNYDNRAVVTDRLKKEARKGR